jgi:AcrR family transcriptional regulator
MKKILPGKNQKQHILDTAVHLIARKGFHAVGVREIASKARVNVSMISYYFGGKAGILKAINEVYFKRISDILKNLSEGERRHEEFFGKYLEQLIDFFVEKRDYCRVAILELPIEHPEILDYKIEMIKINKSFVKKYLKEKYNILDKYQQVIIGPAFMGMAFSNFLLGEINQKITKIKYDKKFYKKYTETISTLFFTGIKGIISEKITKKDEKIFV